MNNLIGISGKMGSGKDLLTEILQYYYWREELLGVLDSLSADTLIVPYSPGILNEINPSFFHENKKFADAIKDTVCNWIGCTRLELEGRDFKERPLSSDWWYYESREDKERTPYSKHIITTYDLIKLTPRIILQRLGTEGGRDAIHPNIWVNTLLGKYKPSDRWIISDCRFPNEADAIKEKGGVVVRINRPSLDLSDERNNHTSETALDRYSGFDHVFINDGTINDLVGKVEAWMS